MMNGLKSVWGKGRKVAFEPIELLANLAQIGTVVFPVWAAIFGYERIEEIAGPRDPLSFPLRLLLLIAFVSVLGWGLGYCIRMLTRVNNDAMQWTATILSAAWALLTVAVAEGLSVKGAPLPEFALFMFLGTAIVACLLMFQMRAKAGVANAAMIEDRATMTAVFTGVCLIAALFVLLGAQI